MNWLLSLLKQLLKLFTPTGEIPSPSDIVPETSIGASVSDAGAMVSINLARLNIPFTKIPKVWIPPIPDTNSMDGIFDYGNNNILIAGADEVDQRVLIDFIKVGDIAVYRTTKVYAIHRIVEIGNDKKGRYFRFKGDNNAVKDPDFVRDNEIEWLSVGVIY